MKIGDVKPSKILNIDKEESYDTYENKLIYTLIQNMKIFVSRKKKTLEQFQNEIGKNDRQFDYEARSQVGKEQVNINVSLNAKKTSQDAKNDPDSIDNILKRIENLEIKILDLTCNNVYKIIDKKHITLVRDPIKKTNVILKNVNFQYAVKLWNYMQEHIDDSISKKKGKNDYEDNSITKKMMDESFYLDYLVLNTIDKGGKIKEKNTKELSEALVDNMLEKVINLDSNISKEDLQKLIESKYQIIKYKIVVNESQIEKIFTKYIDKYLDKIERIKM